MSSGGISSSQTGWDQSEGVQKTAMMLWDAGSVSWIKATGGVTGSNVTVSNFPSSFGATQVGAWDITNVTGTVSLPIGAAIATKQDTGNTSLASIDSKIIAVNTGAVVISSGSITANAGTNLNTSLLALEAGGNLATIAGKDFATQTTLAALNAKVTAVNTGAVVVSSGSITANAGTNLNTSALALEAGGNLATLVAKDFATSAKQDTGNTSLATISTNTAPLVTAQAASSAGVTGPLVQAVVSDVPSSFLTDTVQPLSLTADGRLRVSTVMSQMDQVWHGTFTSPWFSDNSWLESKGELYV